jgi:hypothetical protein
LLTLSRPALVKLNPHVSHAALGLPGRDVIAIVPYKNIEAVGLIPKSMGIGTRRVVTNGGIGRRAIGNNGGGYGPE